MCGDSGGSDELRSAVRKCRSPLFIQVIGSTHAKLIVHVAKPPDGHSQSHQSKLVVLSRVRCWSDLALLSEPGFDYLHFLSSIHLDPDLQAEWERFERMAVRSNDIVRRQPWFELCDLCCT